MKTAWCLYFSLIVCCGIATARWATEEDAASRYELRRTFIKVKVERTKFCEEKTTAATQLCVDCYDDDNNFDSNVEDIQHIVRQDFPSVNLSKDAQYIVDGMSEITNCPERLWPDLILHEKPYIILDKKNKTPMVVSHKYCKAPSYRSPKFEEFTKDHLKVEFYGVTRINGDETIIIPVNSEDSLYTKFMKPEQIRKKNLEVLVHEAFHNCDQKNSHWNRKHIMNKRFSMDADDCTPRKYRSHVRYYLEKALKAKENSDKYSTALRQASYWHKKYIDNFPEELKIADAADAIEGSADFVGKMAVALKEKGCQATDKELQEAFLKHYFNAINPIIMPSPSMESYSIGSLSSALLARSSFSEWQKKIKDGNSPVQLLLKNVSPLQTAEVPEIKKACRTFDRTAKARKLEVENINKTLESENYIALSITHTHNTQKGTIQMVGHANKGIKNGYSKAILNASSIVNTGSSKIAFKHAHVLKPKNANNQCGSDQSVILIPKRGFSSEEGSSIYRINLSEEKDIITFRRKDLFSLEGHAEITKQIEQKGPDIWCAK